MNLLKNTKKNNQKQCTLFDPSVLKDISPIRGDYKEKET